jgi:hypothetical protein
MRLLLIALLAGCAHTRHVVDSGDRSFPLETRRILALAEDDQALASLELVRAEAALDDARVYAADLRDAGAELSDARVWTALAKARVAAAQRAVDQARARRGLSWARLALTRGETALRHDRWPANLERLLRDVAAWEQRWQEATAERRQADEALRVAEHDAWRTGPSPEMVAALSR